MAEVQILPPAPLATTHSPAGKEGATEEVDEVRILCEWWLDLFKETSMATFEPGTIVMLKSGGPHMTALYEGQTDGVHCIWFDASDKRQDSFFDPRALKVVGKSKLKKVDEECPDLDLDSPEDFEFKFDE